MTDFALARRNMVDGQLRPNRVTNAALLAAVSELPRERFLPDGLRSVAFADGAMVLARLIQALQTQPEDKVLVVGSGRGYGAALLSRLAKSVVAVESDAALASAADQTIKDLGIVNISQTVAKLERGAPAEAPYDAILIEGAVHEIPRALLDQLAEGGRLTTVMAAAGGVLGVAQLGVKEGGTNSRRAL